MVAFWLTTKYPSRQGPVLPWLTGLGGVLGDVNVKFPSVVVWKVTRSAVPAGRVMLMLKAGRMKYLSSSSPFWTASVTFYPTLAATLSG